jgi:glutaredoxin-like protein
MSILRDEDKKAVQERLAPMTGEVKLVMFTQEMECQYCRETHELLEEVSALSDKLSVEIYDFVKDKDKAEAYNIDKVPATLVLDKDESRKNLRYYGVPSGYEFASLLDDILMVSSGDSGLSDATKEALAKLEKDVHMQVFVTPTCPYCPGAVRLAHQMAFESDKVTGDMVEATEFPQLSMKYNVRGVPRTIINEDNAVEGMMPEANVLEEVLKAV